MQLVLCLKWYFDETVSFFSLIHGFPVVTQVDPNSVAGEDVRLLPIWTSYLATTVIYQMDRLLYLYVMETLDSRCKSTFEECFCYVQASAGFSSVNLM